MNGNSKSVKRCFKVQNGSVEERNRKLLSIIVIHHQLSQKKLPLNLLDTFCQTLKVTDLIKKLLHKNYEKSLNR